MNYIVSALILFYGGIVTFATTFAIGFGNAFSGWGDGATVSHDTSLWSAWPTAVFFILSAIGPFIRGRQEKWFLFIGTLLLLFLGFMVTIGGVDGLFIPFCVFVLSILVWAPLLFAPNCSPPPEDTPKRPSS